jgi:hypothetical protein
MCLYHGVVERNGIADGDRVFMNPVMQDDGAKQKNHTLRRRDRRFLRIAAIFIVLTLEKNRGKLRESIKFKEITNAKNNSFCGDSIVRIQSGGLYGGA